MWLERTEPLMEFSKAETGLGAVNYYLDFLITLSAVSLKAPVSMQNSDRGR
jgi:hypothetical protein